MRVVVNGFMPLTSFQLIFCRMPIELKLGGNVETLDAVVYDCDGVLLETIPAKLRAYMEWLPLVYEALRGDFAAYNQRSFGLSRVVQIEHFYCKLVGQTVSEEFIESEVDRFKCICEPLCETAPWVEGSKEFVEVCNRAGCDSFVLSGTPQFELEAMLRQRNAIGLFKEIYGFPETKKGGLARILRKSAHSPGKVLFVGDAEADAAAAKALGVHFVYRPSEADHPQTPILTEAPSLLELLV